MLIGVCSKMHGRVVRLCEFFLVKKSTASKRKESGHSHACTSGKMAGGNPIRTAPKKDASRRAKDGSFDGLNSSQFGFSPLRAAGVQWNNYRPLTASIFSVPQSQIGGLWPGGFDFLRTGKRAGIHGLAEWTLPLRRRTDLAASKISLMVLLLGESSFRNTGLLLYYLVSYVHEDEDLS